MVILVERSAVRIYFLLLGIISFFIFPTPVSAHAFGALYNLPVPFWLYLFGGAATLLISFILVGFFLKGEAPIKATPSIQVSFDRTLIVFLKPISLGLFILTILTGLFGIDNSLSNFNMTFFWIIFLLGFYYLTAFIGDLYSQINPFKCIFSGIKSKVVEYPKRFGYFPAVFFFMALIWIELFWGISPFKLSLILIIYTVINFIGVSLIGFQDWFKYFEFSSILFNLVGKLSLLRQPLQGLIEESNEHFSLLIFILFMLSSTAFDGIHTTVPWYLFVLKFGDNFALTQKISLILSPLFFLFFYLLAIWGMKILTKSKEGAGELSSLFAFSLIPIAFVYNIAHYYTLFINQGQEIIRLISDPLGLNWNLFGTANFENQLFTDAGLIWHSQVGVILLGHIIAVYLAHLIALRIFKNRKLAIISQIPILALMIIYTMTGLWILSQPLTSKI